MLSSSPGLLESGLGVALTAAIVVTFCAGPQRSVQQPIAVSYYNQSNPLPVFDDQTSSTS